MLLTTFSYWGEMQDPSTQLVGQEAALRVDASAREFVVIHAGEERGRVAIKDLVQRILPFDACVELLTAQARGDRGVHLPATS